MTRFLPRCTVGPASGACLSNDHRHGPGVKQVVWLLISQPPRVLAARNLGLYVYTDAQRLDIACTALLVKNMPSEETDTF